MTSAPVPAKLKSSPRHRLQAQTAMPPPNKFEITFVVGGSPTAVEANANQPLHVAARKALRQTGQTGDIEGWNAVGPNNEPLGLDAKVGDLGLAAGIVVFLQKDVGAGG